MKKAFKYVALALVFVMCITVFASCGNKPDGNETTAPDGETAPVADGASIMIGATGPLTGDASSYGISVNQGAQIAVDEINAAGGLNGITFNFVMKDDKAKAEDAAIAYDQLMDSGMKVSIGSVTSGACESFAAKSVDDNLFFITPSASAAGVIAERANGFRVCFGDPDQGILAADKLVKDYKMTNIGCIYDTSDPYSTGIYEAFKGQMDSLNASFTTKTFDSENNKDFSTQVDALKDCDAIFLPFYYTEAGLVARACAAKGCTAILFGCDGLDGVADQIDATVTNEVSYITPFDVNSSDAKVADFVSKYESKYSAKPDQFAADGYDAIYVIFEAMKAAGIDSADISVSDLCDKLTAAITSEGFSFAGVTGNMTWDATGAPTKEPIIVTVEK